MSSNNKNNMDSTDPPSGREMEHTNNNRNNEDAADVTERSTTRANMAHLTGRHANGVLIDGKNTLGPSEGTARVRNNAVHKNNTVRADPPPSQPRKDRLSEDDEIEPTDRDTRNFNLNLPHQQQQQDLMVDALPVVATVIATAVEEGDAYPYPNVGATAMGTDATATTGDGASAGASRFNRFGICLLTVIAVVLVAVLVVGAVCGTGGCGSSRNSPDSILNSSPITGNSTAPSSSAAVGVTPTTASSFNSTGSRSTDIVNYINSVTLTGRIIAFPYEQSTGNNTGLVHEQALQWLIEDENSLQLTPDTAANRFRLRQRYALRLLFVKENSADLWYNRTGWATSDADECSWTGVTCTLVDVVSGDDASDNSTNTDGSLMQYAVTELNLYFNNVDGILATDLGLLSFLSRFIVSDNRLTGSIPTSLSQWSNLESLYMYYNQLNGTIPAVLGSEWSGLIYAHFDSNNFTGAVPSSFCSLANLIALEADCVSEVTCAVDCCTYCF